MPFSYYLCTINQEQMHFKVGIIGPESTAKSTLSQQLAKHFGAGYIPEYARTYIENLAHPYTYQDVENIAQHQIQQLNTSQSLNLQTSKPSNLLFYDTELIITKVWFLHKYNRCPDFLLEALKQNPIDFYLICAPDLPFIPDPLRENPNLRDYLFEWYLREIQAQNKPYAIVSGINQARIESAIKAVNAYLHSQ